MINLYYNWKPKSKNKAISKTVKNIISELYFNYS